MSEYIKSSDSGLTVLARPSLSDYPDGVARWRIEGQPYDVLQIRTDGTILAGDGTAPPLPAEGTVQLRTYADTSVTLQVADAGAEVEFTSDEAVTVTIPADTFPVGAVMNVRQIGEGAVTIQGDEGVTLRAPNGSSLAQQYSTASLVQRADNEWVLSGDTA